MIKSVWYIFFGIICFTSCINEFKQKVKPTINEPDVFADTIKLNTIFIKHIKPLSQVNDSIFVRLADYSDDFVYDLRYATENNFLNAQVYDCAECYTRVKTAKALIVVNKAFKEKGVKIKFFDCYRPNSVQYKMWELVPNPQYVAEPVYGSVHNRGGAVDITLVDLKGKELDMGTDFDFFGRKAYHDYYNLPQSVIDNRILLKETMEEFDFESIRSEWWHYNLKGARQYEVADFKWGCQ